MENVTGGTMNYRVAGLIICSAVIFSSNAHFMSRLWPQKKLTPAEYGDTSAAGKVLIAGKGSDYRNTVISELKDKLLKDSLYVRVIDLDEIYSQAPEKWSAILLINRCVAWSYDSRVLKYLKENPVSNKVIIFTTSADPEGCIPSRKKNRMPKVDTYSSASQPEMISKTVDRLYKLLKKVMR
jgi:hypothetical protein